MIDFIEWLISAPFICLGWIIVGAIAGTLARSLMKSKNRSLLSDIILGLAGAFVGGFLASLLGIGPNESVNGIEQVIISLIIATAGASLLIGLRRALT